MAMGVPSVTPNSVPDWISTRSFSLRGVVSADWPGLCMEGRIRDRHSRGMSGRGACAERHSQALVGSGADRDGLKVLSFGLLFA